MKIYLKIFAAVFVMIFSCITSVFGMQLPDGGEEVSSTYTMLDTSSYGDILKVGLIPDSAHTLSTKFSGCWTGMMTNNMIKMMNFPSDLTQYDEIHFSAYSPQKTNSQFALVVRSPNSSEGACYYLNVNKIDWEGWKEFKIKLNSLEDFTETRSPDWGNITQIYFQSNGFTLPDPESDTMLYFDNVEITKKKQGRTFSSKINNQFENAAKDTTVIYKNSYQILYRGNLVSLDTDIRPRYLDNKIYVNSSFIKKYVTTKWITRLTQIKSVQDIDDVIYYPLDEAAEILDVPYVKNGALEAVALANSSSVSAFENEDVSYIAAYKLSYMEVSDEAIISDIPKIKSRLLQRLIGGDITNDSVVVSDDWTEQKVREAKDLMESLTKELARGNITRYSLWDGTVSTDECIIKSYKKIRTMALAYNLVGTETYKDPEVLEAIRIALEWMYENKYGEMSIKSNYSGNWWDWCIGGSLDLTDILILMEDELDREDIEKYLIPVKHFSSIVPSLSEYELNKQWLYRIKMIAALLESDAQSLCEIRDNCLENIKYVTEGDGFYNDGSYIAHQSVAYNFGYGSNVLFAAVRNMAVLSGTALEITDPHADIILEILKGAYPNFIYNGRAMSAFSGSGFSGFNEYELTGAYLACLIDINEIYNDSDISGIIKMQANKSKTYINLSPYYADRLSIYNIDDNSSEYNVMSNIAFNNIDRVVHSRPDFALCIAMSSDKVSRYESLTAQNMKGWYTGDGATYLYIDGGQSFDDKYYSSADMTKIPGTTELDAERTEESFSKYNALLTEKSFVGAVSLNNNGFAAMDFSGYSSDGMHGYDAFESDLSAKKGYLMVDDVIICFGGGITCSSDVHVKTYVDNTVTKITNQAEQFVVNDGHVGYCFLNGTEYKIDSGDEYSVISIDHGAKPSNDEYVYAILPNATSDKCEEFLRSSDVKIINNTADIQAIEYKDYTAVAFYKPGSCCGIETSIPLILMKYNKEISVVEPTGAYRNAKLTINGKNYDIEFNEDGVCNFTEK